MSDFTIVRTDAPPLDDEARSAVRRFINDCYRGIDEKHQKAWNRLWRMLDRLESGEIAFLEVVFPRNPKFHAKFFALLKVGYDAWEPDRVRKSWRGMPVSKNFERFRKDVVIAAGYYDQTFNLDGELRLEAKSLKFSSMDQLEFEEVYSAVADVLLQKVLLSYSGRAELDAVVERVMRFV